MQVEIRKNEGFRKSKSTWSKREYINFE